MGMRKEEEPVPQRSSPGEVAVGWGHVQLEALQPQGSWAGGQGCPQGHPGLEGGGHWPNWRLWECWSCGTRAQGSFGWEMETDSWARESPCNEESQRDCLTAPAPHGVGPLSRYSFIL